MLVATCDIKNKQQGICLSIQQKKYKFYKK